MNRVWLLLVFALAFAWEEAVSESLKELDTEDLDQLAQELQRQLDEFNAEDEAEVGMLDKDGWIMFPPDDVPFDATDPNGDKYWERKKAEAAAESALARRERGEDQ